MVENLNGYNNVSMSRHQRIPRRLLFFRETLRPSRIFREVRNNLSTQGHLAGFPITRYKRKIFPFSIFCSHSSLLPASASHLNLYFLITQFPLPWKVDHLKSDFCIPLRYFYIIYIQLMQNHRFIICNITYFNLKYYNIVISII